jgi:large subunit ribosomal protein L10
MWERRIGRRTEGFTLASVPAMSCPRLPARNPFGDTLNFLTASQEASGSRHRRGKPSFLNADRRARAADAVRTFCPAPGVFARLRGQAQVAAALDSDPESRGAACAIGGVHGIEARRPEMSTVDRTEKKEAVAALHDVFSKTSAVVVAHYSGLTVAQMQRLRKQMRQAGAQVKVAKNSLAQIALKGTDVASIGPLLKGPTLIAHSSDPVAAAKAAVAFAKDHEKFVLLGGAMGKTALDVDGVRALATLPSLDELRAKLLGLLTAPATKLARLANAPAAKLARVVGAYAAKDAA